MSPLSVYLFYVRSARAQLVCVSMKENQLLSVYLFYVRSARAQLLCVCMSPWKRTSYFQSIFLCALLCLLGLQIFLEIFAAHIVT